MKYLNKLYETVTPFVVGLASLIPTSVNADSHYTPSYEVIPSEVKKQHVDEALSAETFRQYVNKLGLTNKIVNIFGDQTLKNLFDNSYENGELTEFDLKSTPSGEGYIFEFSSTKNQYRTQEAKVEDGTIKTEVVNIKSYNANIWQHKLFVKEVLNPVVNAATADGVYPFKEDVTPDMKKDALESIIYSLRQNQEDLEQEVKDFRLETANKLESIVKAIDELKVDARNGGISQEQYNTIIEKLTGLSEQHGYIFQELGDIEKKVEDTPYKTADILAKRLEERNNRIERIENYEDSIKQGLLKRRFGEYGTTLEQAPERLTIEDMLVLGEAARQLKYNSLRDQIELEDLQRDKLIADRFKTGALDLTLAIIADDVFDNRTFYRGYPRLLSNLRTLNPNIYINPYPILSRIR